jgi:hypothetical protein
MARTKDDTADFGDGAFLTTVTVEVFDTNGNPIQTIPQSAMIDASGAATGRVWKFTITIPDGVTSGFYIARDNLSPELILPALAFNVY